MAATGSHTLEMGMIRSTAAGGMSGKGGVQNGMRVWARQVSSSRAACAAKAESSSGGEAESSGGGEAESKGGEDAEGGEKGGAPGDRWVNFVGLVGAMANWAIPAAAISHIWENEDPTKIDPRMTSALSVYSLLFIRWSLAITPPNYPLLICHISNEIAQVYQLVRWSQAPTGGHEDDGASDVSPLNLLEEGEATTTAVAAAE